MITAYVGFYDEALLSWVAVLIGLVGGAVLGAVALIPELVRRHPGTVVVDAAVQAPSYS